jgi:hypothetical protein
LKSRITNRLMRKLASLFVLGAAVCQTSTCSLDGGSLLTQWLTSITTIWLNDYFANQFNVSSSGF